MQVDQIQTRIEQLTTSLPQAVQSSQGAQFAMLLSLIATNRDNSTAQPMFASSLLAADGPTGEGFQLPQAKHYPSVEELHTPPLVERLNRAVNSHLPGDFAYINSHILNQSEQLRPQRTATDTFEKIALMSAGKLMIEHIDQSQLSVLA